MTVFDSTWKKDEVIGRLFDEIKKHHRVAEHTKKSLIAFAAVKDYCEEARHFVAMGGNPQLFIHYDVATWFEGGRFLIKIDSIGVYDDFMEYERARVSQLHSAKNKDIPNIN